MESLLSISACSARRIGPIKRRADFGGRQRVLEGDDMSPDDAGSTIRDRRRARLSASLRENLRRRKAQQRSRAAEAPPGPPAREEGPGSPDPKA